MFYCAVTGKMSKPGEKCRKIVTEKRDRTYTKRVRDMETGKLNTVDVGRGWEIVKEINATEEGEKIWYQTHPLAATG